jgi:glutaredoxin
MRSKIILLAAACAAVSLSSYAATVYKTTGPDGKVIYTDQPPADGKAANGTKALDIKDEPTSPLPEAVLKYQEQLKRSANKRIQETPKRASASATPVLFSAAWCGYCRRAKAYLQQNGIAFQEHDIDTEAGMQAFVEAGGGRGVPLLIVNGGATRGFSEGSYDRLFAKKK